MKENSIFYIRKFINKKGFHYIEIIDPDNCNACGLCYQVCPDVAIEIWK